MTPEAAAQTVNYVAQQSDRWLFIALLLVGFFAIAFMTRWFMFQLDKANAATRMANEQLSEHLKSTTLEVMKVITEVRVSMQRMNELVDDHWPQKQ